MEARLVALAILLREFGVTISVDSLDQRKTIQKAVYLGQLSGVSFGYSYGWYLMGPYSPSLTQDYFQLAHEIAGDNSEWEGKSFTEPVKSLFDRIKPLMSPPHDWNFERADWLELVASLHFLLVKSRQSLLEAEATLKKEKAKLAPYVSQAMAVLKKNGLL